MPFQLKLKKARGECFRFIDASCTNIISRYVPYLLRIGERDKSSVIAFFVIVCAFAKIVLRMIKINNVDVI